MSRFRPAKGLPVWRKIALAAWAAPKESTIHGSLEIDAAEALGWIERKRAEGYRVTITHLVAKAVAVCVAEHPQINGIVSRGRLMLRGSTDIFLQVSYDGGDGLAGATIRDANTKSVTEIAKELDERVQAIRSHRDKGLEKTTSSLSKVPPPFMRSFLRLLAWLQYDLGLSLEAFGVERDSFGSAMVTNVGMFGLQQGFAPIFPLGRSPIVLLVGEVTEKPVARQGKVVVRPVLGLHATIDHRIIDGYHAGLLAKRLRELLEDPSLLEGG